MNNTIVQNLINGFHPVEKDSEVHVKSNFEILATPGKIPQMKKEIAGPKKRPPVRPDNYVPPKVTTKRKGQSDKEE